MHVQNSGKTPALRFDVNFTIPVKYRCSKSAPVLSYAFVPEIPSDVIHVALNCKV